MSQEQERQNVVLFGALCDKNRQRLILGVDKNQDRDIMGATQLRNQSMFLFIMLTFTLVYACLVQIFGEPVATPRKDFMIEIATIEDEVAPVYRGRPPVRRSPPRRETKQPKSTKPKVTDHPLYQDCVDALVGLGERSVSAKQFAKDILGSQDVNSVEDFLRTVYSRA